MTTHIVVDIFKCKWLVWYRKIPIPLSVRRFWHLLRLLRSKVQGGCLSAVALVQADISGGLLQGLRANVLMRSLTSGDPPYSTAGASARNFARPWAPIHRALHAGSHRVKYAGTSRCQPHCASLNANFSDCCRFTL